MDALDETEEVIETSSETDVALKYASALQEEKEVIKEEKIE